MRTPLRRCTFVLLTFALAALPFASAFAQPAPSAEQPAAAPAAAPAARAPGMGLAPPTEMPALPAPIPQPPPIVPEPPTLAPPPPAPSPSVDVTTAPLPPFPTPKHGEYLDDGEGDTADLTAHEGGHRAAGNRSVIENWWSWDYGPEPHKRYHHPPFGIALINFAVFLLILARLFGKSFTDFLRNRHHEVRRAIDRARDAQEQAERHLKQIEDRTRNLESEINELVASYRRQAEAERQSIVQRAEAEAERLLKDAESQAQAAIVAARWSLEQRAALLAVDLAEKIVRSQLRDEDHRKLNENFLSEVESLAKHAPAALAKETP